MLKTFASIVLHRMERRAGYDVGYLRRLLGASPRSFRRFAALGGLVDRRAAPAEALAAAGIAATLHEDCGPCVQISVDLALAAGVAPANVRAILAGEEAGMSQDAALAWRFARASLQRESAAAEPLRDEIVRRWGEPGLAALALQITASRMHPTLKYALGFGQSCSRVVVQGASARVATPLLAV